MTLSRPESLEIIGREAVARAIYHGVITDSRRRLRSCPHWEATSETIRDEYRRLADFAIAAFHPPAKTGIGKEQER